MADQESSRRDLFVHNN